MSSLLWVLIITAYATTASAIEALHFNVYDYIIKPFEYDRLKAAIDGALARIEANRLRNDMINMLTHDIKVPLNSILGYTSLIFDEKEKQIHPQAKDFLNTVTNNANKILALVDNFLTSCKVDSGKLILCLREININELINDILIGTSFDIEKKKINLTIKLLENPTLFMGDENLLYRALGNLLNNAIKYSPIDGDISIVCEEALAENSPLEKKTLKIEVENTGEPIPLEDLPFIFEKFRRAKNAPYIRGSGLGLYVLKSIANAHNGIVEASSQPDKNVFVLYLPL